MDTYLETCRITFSGNIRLRISPEIHKKTYIAASLSGKSLNQFIQEALIQKVQNKIE